ncbi:MAG: VOC family protein [Polyangiales bacterium]
MELLGINHITFAVRSLEPSFRFYVDVLGAKPRARWKRGAFLTLGGTWLALLVGEPEVVNEDNYSHIAYSVAPSAFAALDARIRAAGTHLWSENQTAGDSLYFSDPDGHRLEIHASDLEARLDAMDQKPPEGYRRLT